MSAPIPPDPRACSPPPRPEPRAPRAAPTEGARVARRGLAWPPGVVVAHPLLAAAPGHAHPPGVAAPDAWGARAEAERRAAHRAAHARAVVLAVGLEGLAVVVAHAVQHAAHADHLCGHRRRGSGRWAPASPAGQPRPRWTTPPHVHVVGEGRRQSSEKPLGPAGGVGGVRWHLSRGSASSFNPRRNTQCHPGAGRGEAGTGSQVASPWSCPIKWHKTWS